MIFMKFQYLLQRKYFKRYSKSILIPKTLDSNNVCFVQISKFYSSKTTKTYVIEQSCSSFVLDKLSSYILTDSTYCYHATITKAPVINDYVKEGALAPPNTTFAPDSRQNLPFTPSSHEHRTTLVHSILSNSRINTVNKHIRVAKVCIIKCFVRVSCARAGFVVARVRCVAAPVPY